jgi:hypothetical protein
MTGAGLEEFQNDLPTIGVYEIVCRGRSYFGSAVYVRGRFACHRCALRAGRHYNKDLQRDFIEHGEDAFTFRILSLHHDRDVALREEAARIEAAINPYNAIRDIDIDAMLSRREKRRSHAHPLALAYANRSRMLQAQKAASKSLGRAAA